MGGIQHVVGTDPLLSQTFTGTYTMFPDGNGSANIITQPGGGSETLDLVLTSEDRRDPRIQIEFSLAYAVLVVTRITRCRVVLKQRSQPRMAGKLCCAVVQPSTCNGGPYPMLHGPI